jgi:ABC-2 type transport system permease protein
MKKYWQLLKLSWQNGLVYRTSLFLWRLRQFLSSLMSLTVWSVIFAGTSSAFGYSQPEMITYIFLAAFLQSMIRATALHSLGSRIYSGEITNQLLKPVSIFGYLAMEDLADKVRNVFFICIETFLLFLIFKPELPPLPDAATLGFFIVLTLFGVVLHFIITIFFGTLGFWSPDTWGPKFIFFMLIDFTAGKLFPLNILPKVLQDIIAFTPFPYFSFIQTQAFLGKLNPTQLWQHLLIVSIWTVALGYITYTVWQKGIKDYSAAGQ